MTEVPNLKDFDARLRAEAQEEPSLEVPGNPLWSQPAPKPAPLVIKTKGGGTYQPVVGTGKTGKGK